MANGEIISLETDRKLRIALAEYSKCEAKPDFVEGVEAFARANRIPVGQGVVATLVRLDLAPGLVRVQVNDVTNYGMALRDIVVTPDISPTFATMGYFNHFPAASIGELPLELGRTLTEAEGQGLTDDLHAMMRPK